jgi:chromosomal replication initiator protein
VANGVLTIPLSGPAVGTVANPRRDSSPPAAALEATPAEPVLSEFIAGDENALAAAALAPLLEGVSTEFNPLVLYGPHGSGKTHLALGLADWWQARFPSAQVVCLTGADFARQYAAAHHEGRLDAWRDELRQVDLFILEDLGELAGKQPAQQELLHTLDALADREGLVVVTARTLPSHWNVLSAPLRSRLSAALVVPLAFPARATRRLILERLAERRNLPLPRRALDGLADGLSGGVPMLASAIWELELAARLDGESIDPARVSQLVSRRDEDSLPKLRVIARLTARHFGLKLAELKSPDRRRALVGARCVAMYLARQLTSCSLGEIGEFFGGRDHTTVLHGCRRTEKLLRHDSAVRQAVADVRKMLVSA